MGKFFLLVPVNCSLRQGLIDQASISCLNGLEPEAKAASGWSARGEGMGGGLSVITPPLYPGEGLADLHEGYSL